MSGKFCCPDFARHATNLTSVKPGMYPPGLMVKAQFERDGNGKWAINGCCGGGCYVVRGMSHCPFCGDKL